MIWKSSFTQSPVRPFIDLTRLKQMTEEDWRKIVCRVPFTREAFVWLDYRDTSNIGRQNFVFLPRTFKTATQAGLTMLQTLNFTS